MLSRQRLPNYSRSSNPHELSLELKVLKNRSLRVKNAFLNDYFINLVDNKFKFQMKMNANSIECNLIAW